MGELMTHNFETVCNNSSEFVWYSLCLRAGTKDKNPNIDIIYARLSSWSQYIYTGRKKNRITPQIPVLWSPTFSDTFCTPNYTYC